MKPAGDGKGDALKADSSQLARHDSYDQQVRQFELRCNACIHAFPWSREHYQKLRNLYDKACPGESGLFLVCASFGEKSGGGNDGSVTCLDLGVSAVVQAWKRTSKLSSLYSTVCDRFNKFETCIRII